MSHNDFEKNILQAESSQKAVSERQDVSEDYPDSSLKNIGDSISSAQNGVTQNRRQVKEKLIQALLVIGFLLSGIAVIFVVEGVKRFLGIGITGGTSLYDIIVVNLFDPLYSMFGI